MHRVKGVAFRYWSAELLPGELEGVGSDLAVTSPELTLLMLASKVSALHLALMMSEMCGGFSSVHLSEEDAEAVRMGVQQGVFAYAGWARCSRMSAECPMLAQLQVACFPTCGSAMR